MKRQDEKGTQRYEIPFANTDVTVPDSKPGKPPWQIAEELDREMPVPEGVELPTDLAEQHDHYAWGAERRNT